MAKRVWKAKQVIKGWDDKPITITKTDNPFDDEDTDSKVGSLTVFDAMFLITTNFKVETLDDSSKKKAVKQALLKASKSGKIELEPDIFKWLKAASEKISPIAWQDNANEVHDEIVEGFQYENEPSKSSKKAAGKKRADAQAAEESDESRAEEE